MTVVLANSQIAPGFANDLPVGAKILDPDIMLYIWPYPTISPDGRRVAYISKGYVCLCNVDDPAPRRLSAVPNTWTDLLARPENADADGNFNALFHGDSREEIQAVTAKVSATAYGIYWTNDSQGFVYSLLSWDAAQQAAKFPMPPKTKTESFFANVQGEVTKLASVDSSTPTRGINAGILTRDHKFLVNTEGDRPLIWDVAANKPHATPFLCMTPSSTSGRWICVEKDTRQLVIVDEQFNVVKRFSETLPKYSFAYNLVWSPDERYVIWRNVIGFDWYSNWEGCRLELTTGDRLKLTGPFSDELTMFTGNRGEIIRAGRDGKQGARSGLMTTGAHVQLIPDREGTPVDLWTTQQLVGQLDLRIPANPPGSRVQFSPDFQLFTLVLHRSNEPPYGLIYYLADRHHNLWRFPGPDNGEYISPYEVVGFAHDGKSIVAYDRRRLFTLPVAVVQDPANKLAQ
jgi:hypothetical protein